MKICIATGTRAEYGLLKPLIRQIQGEPAFTLQVLVTGAHLSPEFGLTYRQIEADGVTIDCKVEMLLSSDTAAGICKSMGLGMIGFADAFTRLQPELLVILGDRYEMLALAAAANVFRIPIAHLHGGEITEGAYDDAMRHAITKLSHLHFTSTAAYRQRVIQLGEPPECVHHVGAIGLDLVYSLPLLPRAALEQALGIRFASHNFLVAFHPETLAGFAVGAQFDSLLQALDQQQDSLLIFTGANADTDGRIINRMMEDYCRQHPHKAVFFASLGSQKFLSMMKIADAIVGNSSSGIIEAPSLSLPAINIGERQKGRIQGINVFNCSFEVSEIAAALQEVKKIKDRGGLPAAENPYGHGGTAARIVDHLKQLQPSSLRVKSFYNLNHESF